MEQLLKSLEWKKSEKASALRQYKETKRQRKQEEQRKFQLEKALEIIRMVGLETQKSLQYHISDITSLALDGVFEDPYKLQVNFVERRNKTECDLLFERDGKEIDPLEASGYGAVDVASLALRISSWSMQTPRTRPVIILDEPMRFLSEDRQIYAAQMFRELADKLGLQFIIVTHEEQLTHTADKVLRVSQKNKISKIN